MNRAKIPLTPTPTPPPPPPIGFWQPAEVRAGVCFRRAEVINRPLSAEPACPPTWPAQEPVMKPTAPRGTVFPLMHGFFGAESITEFYFIPSL